MLPWPNRCDGIKEFLISVCFARAEQPGEGARELPEAAEAVRAQQASPPAAEEYEEKEPVQGTTRDQVLPEHGAGLGGGWAAGNLIPGHWCYDVSSGSAADARGISSYIWLC